MAWVKLKYSKSEVKNAGDILRSKSYGDPEFDRALEVLGNWRASHNFPLNTFQIRLRRMVRGVCSTPLVVQRLKRVPSIIRKLKIFKTMDLERMQDIGGCRAVLDDVEQVYKLQKRYLKRKTKHVLLTEKNYIASPKASGYRGVHLVYRYRSDKNNTYNGLRIEIQLRTKIQHAWATAVETVGLFLKHSLKSSEGPQEWLCFFTLIGSEFAFLESTQPVPNTPVDQGELKAKILAAAQKLRVEKKLSAYSLLLKHIEQKSKPEDYYYLLVLQIQKNSLTIRTFKKSEFEKAAELYTTLEKTLSKEENEEIVLVAAESMETLREAYPNYFLDTGLFLEYLKKYLAT